MEQKRNPDVARWGINKEPGCYTNITNKITISDVHYYSCTYPSIFSTTCMDYYQLSLDTKTSTTKFMRICTVLLSPFVVRSVCEVFLGVPRVSSTLKIPGCSIDFRQGIPSISPKLSASGERTQEHKKMVTADDLRSCQVRVLSCGVRSLWV